jgi:hypothetical protein
MFRETNPNMPHDRTPRPWDGFDGKDCGFALGAVIAFVGAGLVFLPAALFAAGALLMVICWRAA